MFNAENTPRYPIKNLINPVNNEHETVEKVSTEIAKSGCVFNGAGYLEPSKTGLFIYSMEHNEEAERKEQARRLYSIFNNVCPEFLNNESILKLLGINYCQVEQAFKTNPDSLPYVAYFGFDLCGPRMVINDLNTDRATIAGFQPEFTEVFGANFPEFGPNFRSFYHGLIPILKKFSGSDKPRVYVMVEEKDPYLSANQQFAERFGFAIGSINQFNPSSTDIIFRALKTEVILKDEKKYEPLLTALKSGLPMVNPLGSYLAGNKGWPVVLVLNGEITCAWFPKSWIVHNGLVATTDSSNPNYLDFMAELKGNRKQFVIKEGFSAGGRAIHIGKEKKNWEWQEIVNKLEDSKSAWVVEVKQPKLETEIFVGECSELGEKIKSGTKRINLLERIYYIGDNDSLTAEVFGAEGSKVNASGFTFPVSFSNGGGGLND